MATSYYKRFRMEIDTASVRAPQDLPDGYSWAPWSDALCERHAWVKFLSFREEIDADVFPNLGNLDGCLRLMYDIRRKPGFLADSTWLIVGPRGDCGGVQGVVDWFAFGAFQNVGVIPDERGLGLGRALVLKALEGFRSAGVRRAYLEVTAGNQQAVRLYRQIGFRKVKTMYKSVIGTAGSRD